MHRAPLLDDRFWRHNPRVILEGGELNLQEPRQQSQRILSLAKTCGEKSVTLVSVETQNLPLCHKTLIKIVTKKSEAGGFDIAIHQPCSCKKIAQRRHYLGKGACSLVNLL